MDVCPSNEWSKSMECLDFLVCHSTVLMIRHLFHCPPLLRKREQNKNTLHRILCKQRSLTDGRWMMMFLIRIQWHAIWSGKIIWWTRGPNVAISSSIRDVKPCESSLLELQVGTAQLWCAEQCQESSDFCVVAMRRARATPAWATCSW